MSTATMTTKGQITVPADVRAKLRLVPGSKLDFVEQPDGSYKIRTKTGDIRRIKGIVKYDGPPVSIEEMKDAIGAAIAEDFKRSVS
jgi:antitoxin PrlF